MKKNYRLILSTKIFHVSEYDYKRINRYLDLVNSYLNSYDNKDTIIGSLEERIAKILIKNGSEYEKNPNN